MTISLSWHDTAQTIISVSLADAFTIEDYAVLAGQLPQMIASVAHRVDVVMHLQPGAGRPPLRGLLPELGILVNCMPPNLGVLVGVGHGALLTNPVSVLAAMAVVRWYFRREGHPILIARSLSHAHRLIAARRDV